MPSNTVNGTNSGAKLRDMYVPRLPRVLQLLFIEDLSLIRYAEGGGESIFQSPTLSSRQQYVLSAPLAHFDLN